MARFILLRGASSILLKLSFVILFLQLCACGSNLGGIKEGVIEYDITYDDSILSDNLLSSMLPKKMEMKFKDDKTFTEFKVGMGIITAGFLCDPEVKSISTFFHVMGGKKLICVTDSVEVDEELEKRPRVTVKYVDELKEIAGYKCKKAVITDSDNLSYDIYYTDEIKIKNSNWWTPLREVKGVMLEYRIKQKNIEMRLTASKISGEELEKSDFAVPPDYERLMCDSMPEIFKNFFQ